MNIQYDEFRVSQDNISKVRAYYKQKANNKQEMPWWISHEDIERPVRFNLRLWSSVELNERKRLIAFCLILFPEIWLPNSNSKTKYNQASLWLCSYAQVVFPNIRDAFTAGGKIATENGHPLKHRYPQVYKTIIDSLPQIQEILKFPSSETIELIEEFHPYLLTKGNPYDSWLQFLCDSTRETVPAMERWIRERPVLETESK